ncbi:uncharacterized protein LOC113866473 [Abrus precatorius]|uniref:Uncharacterized protein LOC113866473 n=1 Tax=Abrus precatorius TaxID=3816 RepID=A0A8B8LQH2_ABRPR|nr:uncharacterized protein LOC113866473 [Abrus precatorius]
MKFVIAVAASRCWFLYQLDVNSAFLHRELSKKIYMNLPFGVSGSTPTTVCKLNKSLYDLKQIIALLIYVDDIVLAGDDLQEIQIVKQVLDDSFKIKDLGSLKIFFGLEIACSTSGIILNQRKYCLELIEECGLSGCKLASSSIDPSMKLYVDQGDLYPDPSSYRRLIGRLLYLTNTRPDISFALQQLSQFMTTSRIHHFEPATWVVRYLKGCPDIDLFYSSETSSLITAFFDSDWASEINNKRSVTGFYVFFGFGLISWKTKKQSTVSRSSSEAEYRALASLTSELQWLKFLCDDFQVNVTTPFPVYCDSKSAIYIAKNPTFHERTKHIKIDYYVACNLVSYTFFM